MKPELSHHDKLLLYRHNCYQMNPPPVLSNKWNEDAWIRHIDRDGRWMDLDALPALRAADIERLKRERGE